MNEATDDGDAMDSGPRPPPDREAPAPAPIAPEPRACGTMYRTWVAFLTLGIVSAILYGFLTYRRHYSPEFTGTRVGDLRFVEISLVREDFHALACAADEEFQGTYCAYRKDGQRRPAAEQEEARIIRQYNTVRNELFLAAGLWAEPVMRAPLPNERFSVMCEFTPLGAMKNPKIRWASSKTFHPANANLVVGRVSNCVIPR
jgi:hypothetical protein